MRARKMRASGDAPAKRASSLKLGASLVPAAAAIPAPAAQPNVARTRSVTAGTVRTGGQRAPGCAMCRRRRQTGCAPSVPKRANEGAIVNGTVGAGAPRGVDGGRERAGTRARGRRGSRGTGDKSAPSRGSGRVQLYQSTTVARRPLGKARQRRPLEGRAATSSGAARADADRRCLRRLVARPRLIYRRPDALRTPNAELPVEQGSPCKGKGTFNDHQASRKRCRDRSGACAPRHHGS